MTERTLTADTNLLSAATADTAFTLRVVQTTAKKQAIAANIVSLLQAATFAAFRTAGGIAASGANTDITSLAGTATNDSAAAGKIGEFISSTVLVGAEVATADSTTVDVTSISLTAGDWDVSGTVVFNPASGTIMTLAIGAINTTSATIPTRPASGGIAQIAATAPATVGHSLAVGVVRISVASTTTVYLVARCQFTVSTMGTYGFIGARRAR